MKIIGVIPARYKSSRFPGKPLAEILGKPMVIHVLEKVAEALGIENTYVATDDLRIKDCVEKFGYKAVMTSDSCMTGTDRLWGFSQKISADIYVNVQGDEPMIDPQDILRIVKVKENNLRYIVNGMTYLSDENPLDKNIPKVLVNNKNELIYMSRLPIPGEKSEDSMGRRYLKQVCIYAFTKEELELFGTCKEKASYEYFEDIEILRFFDLGIKVKMVETKSASLAVDIPTDIQKVEKAMIDAQ